MNRQRSRHKECEAEYEGRGSHAAAAVRMKVSISKCEGLETGGGGQEMEEGVIVRNGGEGAGEGWKGGTGRAPLIFST
jgi:hypothetical protein